MNFESICKYWREISKFDFHGSDFGFLARLSAENLGKLATVLGLKYQKDLYAVELSLEIASWNFLIKWLFFFFWKMPITQTCWVAMKNMAYLPRYPNIGIALR